MVASYHQINHPDGNGRGCQVIQNQDRAALVDLFGDQIGQGDGDASTGFGSRNRKDGIVEFEPWHERDALAASPVQKSPFAIGYQTGEGNHRMPVVARCHIGRFEVTVISDGYIVSVRSDRYLLQRQMTRPFA